MDNKTNFDTQYCASYASRYSVMSRLVLENTEVSSRGLQVKELKDDLSDTCMVVAIFFLKSDSKPSVLKKNNNNEKGKFRSYVDDGVKYYLQDRSGTLELIFTPGFNKLSAPLTGMVLGFVGKLTTLARFECSDIIFPAPLLNSQCFGSGSMGSILVVGNCLLNNGNIEKLKVIADYCRERITAAVLIGDVFGDNVRTEMLENWAREMEIDIFIIPGPKDPTTLMLPQYPLHPLFFSKDSVNGEKNPSGRIFLQQSPGIRKINNAETVILSQYIMNDIVKYLPDNSKEFKDSSSISEDIFMSLLEQLVMARHIVPNAPDTLSCVPYNDHDPFILEKCDILIAGGCKKACSRIFRGTAIVGVPNFDTTSTAVLLSLKDGSVEEICCSDL
ncbi:DNA polymerase delta subunit 2 [Pancytospora epiphaga]|nr:DNA polymerase delta subunit 2 [Pancytospora epiphaga]